MKMAATSQSAASVEQALALEKQERLLDRLRGVDSLLVALSGGADSCYLAWAAHQVLGGRALSITALSPSFSEEDRAQTIAFVAASGVRHEFIETHEFENPLYVANGADRCYHCKTELFEQMDALARERNFRAVAYGINADDTTDFRPGHRAAHEHGVLAPLLDAALGKQEIRVLSRLAGLPTWDRPASACLSSRVPYGTAVTPELLGRIDRAEAILRDLGFRQLRVRVHDKVARIEVAPDEMSRAMEPAVAQQIAAQLKPLGFSFVTLDLEGYRQGSLNTLLKLK
jgi:pyridinium-3,5-biscarboxylic acid mononucleotide sulfurtransferase